MTTPFVKRETSVARIHLAILVAITAVAMASRVDGLGQSSAAPAIAVTHYAAYLEPKLDAGTIAGSVTLTLERADAGVVRLQKGALTIDAVEREGSPIAFDATGQTLTINVGEGAERFVTVRYHGAPRGGLSFAPERRQLYTSFSTSRWMPVMDAPDARATFHLQLVVPREWTVVGNGREVRRWSISSTEDVSEWRQDRPVPTYTFGFAAGDYGQVAVSKGAVAEHYLANGFSDDDLRRVFADTASMLAFFTERSGVPFPGDRYSQILVPRSAGQEMAGYSIVSEEYGRAVLNDPAVVSLLAHELAHQWWGNSVTCREWTHFWLNEGFATFMAAAYREHRFSREVYLRDVDAMRTRYERVRDAGRDRSLVFPNWDSPTADDRTLVYQKGGYTRTYLGRSVTTDDFRRAMEEGTGRDLGTFFTEWVYAAR
jgi:aminopeptidase N